MDLQNIAHWFCWLLMFVGVVVIWINFWIGVFYTTFGFIAIYLMLKLYFKNQRWFTTLEKSKNEKTHGVG